MLGEVLRALGRRDEALARCTEALALSDMSHGPDSLQSAAALLCVGRVQWDRGETAAARIALTRAVEIQARTQVAPVTRAVAHEALAIALHDVDPAQASTLAQQAATEYRAAGPAHAADLERAQTLAGSPPN